MFSACEESLGFIRGGGNASLLAGSAGSGTVSIEHVDRHTINIGGVLEI
jgi:hypothetical protein